MQESEPLNCSRSLYQELHSSFEVRHTISIHLQVDGHHITLEAMQDVWPAKSVDVPASVSVYLQLTVVKTSEMNRRLVMELVRHSAHIDCWRGDRVKRQRQPFIYSSIHLLLSWCSQVNHDRTYKYRSIITVASTH